jgi:Uma2 family endonuclease
MVIRNPHEPLYPSSDGKPMAENTIQYRWITIIKGGMDVVFRDDPNVFIAGDLLWYPVEGEPAIRTAPDTLIVFGRPKGDRMSYLQWEEDDIAPQVVFEVLSPSNTTSEMAAKLDWYEQYGVEEYYVYDPDRRILQGWVRQGETLRGVVGIRAGFTSPRTKVQLKMEEELVLTGPDGRRFVDYPDLALQRERAETEANRQRERADQEFERAEQERLKKEAAMESLRQEQDRVEQERLKKEAAMESLRQEQDRATEAMARLAKWKELLRSQGIDPDSLGDAP